MAWVIKENLRKLWESKLAEYVFRALMKRWFWAIGLKTIPVMEKALIFKNQKIVAANFFFLPGYKDHFRVFGIWSRIPGEKPDESRIEVDNWMPILSCGR